MKPFPSLLMPTPAQIAAYLLEQDRSPIAGLVLDRLKPTLSAHGKVSSSSFDQWTAKIETHLQTLAACIQFASPLLSADYVRWGGLTYDAQPVFANEVEAVFRAMEHVAGLELPSEPSDVICRHIQSALHSAPNETPAESGPASALAPIQQEYLAALLDTNRSEALRLAMEAVHSGISVNEFYLNVLQPSQREVGRLWQIGEISVAQEHYCTAATQFVMSQLQPYFLQKKPCPKTLVACCVGDELHEVGLRIVSDVFEMEGWNAIYLGANVPADNVAKSLLDCQANVLAVSTTMTRHLLSPRWV